MSPKLPQVVVRILAQGSPLDQRNPNCQPLVLLICNCCTHWPGQRKQDVDL